MKSLIPSVEKKEAKMKIKSIEELKKIRENHLDRINLREHGDTPDNRVEVMIGMATCGISSGARDTLGAFTEELQKEKLNHVKVIPVGCIGYCHSEPTVQVNRSGEPPVLYGNVKPEKVHRIIEEHIKGGTPVKDLILEMDFERA